MKIIIILLVLGAIVILFSNCSQGYKTKNGKVYKMSWNEAHGKTEYLVKKADAKTFEKLKNNYAKDKNYIFYGTSNLENSDPKSFRIISERYAVDKNQAYYYGVPFNVKVINDFKLLNEEYTTDGVDIYCRGQALNVSDIKNWKLIHPNMNSWSTDGKYYYAAYNRVPSKNYSKVIYYVNSNFAKDDKFVYRLGKRFNYNDKGEKLFDIDVYSFTVDENRDIKDKDGYFTFFERKEAYLANKTKVKFFSKHYKFTAIKYESRFTVTRTAYSKVEEIIKSFLEDKTRNYDEYYKQVFGFEDANLQKNIYVNCFCSTKSNWKKEMISVRGGGDCYLSFIVNLENRNITNFRVNSLK